MIIRKAIPFRIGDHTEVHFVDEDYVKLVPIIKEMNSNGLDWVGWFHSHPFKGGDHLYMSRVDIKYQFPAQSQNFLWTALILNPYQISDPSTVSGIRAFRLKWKKKKHQLTKKVEVLNLEIND